MNTKINKPKQYTDKQLEHFFQKWLYTYGGASDVVSLDDYIDTYDDWYGSIDEYSNKVCPCILCVYEIGEDKDEKDIRDEANYLGFDDGGES